MTSDYNDEEIYESSFPADFQNEPEPIDMYGVWVKSGPRDSDSTIPETLAPPESAGEGPEASVEAEPESEPVTAAWQEAGGDEGSLVFESGDETFQADAPEENDAPGTRAAAVSQDVGEGGPSYADFELDDFLIDDTDLTEEAAVSDRGASDETVAADDSTFEENTHIAPEYEYEYEDTDTGEITLEALAHIADEGKKTERPSEKNNENTDFEFEDVGFDEIALDEEDSTGETTADREVPEPAAPRAAPEGIEFEPIRFYDEDDKGGDTTAKRIEHEERENTKETVELEPERASPSHDLAGGSAPASSIPDIDYDVTEETPADFQAVGPADGGGLHEEGQEEEIDVSAFLADFENSEPPDVKKSEPAAGGSGSDGFDNIDLDEFIDAFNESGGGEAKKTESVYDDIEPIDLDLEFDEDYIAETEKIRSSGAASAHSEFFDSDFGVEFVDETAPDGGVENLQPGSGIQDDSAEKDSRAATSSDAEIDAEDFDAMFASIQDEAPDASDASDQKPPKTEAATVDADAASEFAAGGAGDSSDSSYETNEFDDFLSELDNSSQSPVQKRDSAEKKQQGGYTLDVEEDVAEASHSPVRTQTVDEENISVSLFDDEGKTGVQEDEKKDVDRAPLYSSGSDDDEIDKILAEVDFDLPDDGEDGGTVLAEDATPSEDVSEEPPATEDDGGPSVPADDADIPIESSDEETVAEDAQDDPVDLADALPTHVYDENEGGEKNSFGDAVGGPGVAETPGFETPVESPAQDEEKTIDFPQNEEYTDRNDNPGSKDIMFDDLGALESDLASGDFSHDVYTDSNENSEDKMNDKSNEILLTIAEELSSIKKELSDLKQGMIQPVQPEPVQDFQPQKNAASSGFFADDDTDETIALTGDELNNILITADFTEETGDQDKGTHLENEPAAAESDTGTAHGFMDSDVKTAPADDELSQAAPDTPASSDDFTDGLGEVQVDEAGVAETDAPTETIDSAENAAETEKTEQNILDDLEISHITSLEDETGYLSGSNDTESDFEDVAMDEPELESIDFEHEQLQEPELNDFTLDIGDFDETEQEGREESKSADDVQMDFGTENFDVSNAEPSDDSLAAASDTDTADSLDENWSGDSLAAATEGLNATDETVLDEIELELDEEAPSETESAAVSTSDTLDATDTATDTAGELELDEDILQDEIEIPTDNAPDFTPAPQGAEDSPDFPDSTVGAEASPEQKEDDARVAPPIPEEKKTEVSAINTLPSDLKEEIKSVLTYMDQLLENLPEEKIEEFARSEHFEVYKKLFADLGIS